MFTFNLFLNPATVFWMAFSLFFISTCLLISNLKISKMILIAFCICSLGCLVFFPIMTRSSYSTLSEKLCKNINLDLSSCKVEEFSVDNSNEKNNKFKMNLIVSKKERCLESKTFEEQNNMCEKTAKFEVLSQEPENLILISKYSDVLKKIDDPNMIEDLKKSVKSFLSSGTIN